MMLIPSHAVVPCTLSTSVLGIVQVFRLWCPWYHKSLKSFVLATVFVIFLIATGILLYFWMKRQSDVAHQVLLELSWLNGLSTEAVIISRISSTIQDSRKIVHTVFAIAGVLQAVGFGLLGCKISFGVNVAFAGGCLFHVSAAAIVTGLLIKHKVSRHRNVVFIALTYGSAIGGCGFIRIRSNDTFLLANCILECCVNVVLVVLTRIKRHNRGAEATAAFSRSIDEEANASNTGRETLQTEAEQTVDIRNERHGLLTSPSLPRSSPRSSLTIDTTNNQHSTRSLDAQSPLSTPPLQGFEISPSHLLQITESSKGISVQAIAFNSWGDKLRLVNIAWKTLSPEQIIQIKKEIGEPAYGHTCERYSRYQPRKDPSWDFDLILWAGHSLSELIPSLDHHKTLGSGKEIGVEALRASVAE